MYEHQQYDGEQPDLTIYDPIELKADMEELKKERERKNDIQVDGPQMSKQYIEREFARHPEWRREVWRYKDALKNVKTFQKEHPEAEAGTYDAVTCQRIPDEQLDNFCATFHQNYTRDDPYAAYTDEIYAQMCVIAKHQLGSKRVYIGYYGNPEISFDCQSFNTAMDFAIKQNQQSIYCPYVGDVIINDKYNKKTNPIEP